MRHARAFLCFSAIVLTWSQPGLACGDGAVLYKDDFKTLDPSWGFAEDVPNRKLGDKGLTYALEPGNGLALLNNAGLYDDYEVCGKFAIDQGAEDSGTFSLLFWGSNAENHFGVVLSPHFGTFEVFRLQRNKTLIQQDWKESPAVHKGDHVENEMSVQVKENRAVVFINGTKVFEFTGQRPADGSLVGFDMFSSKENKGEVSIAIKEIEVRELK